MKPYKILKPEKSIWVGKILEVNIYEKKMIRLPAKLFMHCRPISKKNFLPEIIKVTYENS